MARIKNWENFQHYHNRCPPWIKLYRELLDDIDFLKICGDSEIGVLVRLWLIASEDKTMKGELPDLETLAIRLHMALPGRVTARELKKVQKKLSTLDHWLVHDASTMLAKSKHDATPERETERETETEREKSGDTRKRMTKHIIPDDWKPNVEHKEIAISRGLDLNDQADRIRDWSRGKAEKRADWDATFRNWLKNSNGGTSANRTQQSVNESLRILREE